MSESMWRPAWETVPDIGDEVVVKIIRQDNSFDHGIGKILAEDGAWHVMDEPNVRVAAWSPLPRRTRGVSP